MPIMTRSEILEYLQSGPTSNKGRIVEITSKDSSQPIYGQFDHIGASLEGRAKTIGLSGGQWFSLESIISVRFMVPEGEEKK